MAIKNDKIYLDSVYEDYNVKHKGNKNEKPRLLQLRLSEKRHEVFGLFMIRGSKIGEVARCQKLRLDKR